MNVNTEQAKQIVNINTDFGISTRTTHLCTATLASLSSWRKTTLMCSSAVSRQPKEFPIEMA